MKPVDVVKAKKQPFHLHLPSYVERLRINFYTDDMGRMETQIMIISMLGDMNHNGGEWPNPGDPGSSHLLWEKHEIK